MHHNTGNPKEEAKKGLNDMLNVSLRQLGLVWSRSFVHIKTDISMLVGSEHAILLLCCFAHRMVYTCHYLTVLKTGKLNCDTCTLFLGKVLST